MTITIAWIREVSGCEELIIASDSRLNGSGGVYWDNCPKIMLLPRSDCFISFAGNTLYSYPMLQQISYSIESYTRSKERAMDLHDLRGHIINVLNSIVKEINIDNMFLTVESEVGDLEFILGGYSWIRKKFSFWKIHYDKNIKKFTYKGPGQIGNLGSIIFAGDQAELAKKNLIEDLKKEFGEKLNESTLKFDWQPFTTLANMLKSTKKSTTIGGPPQLIKAYQHLNTRPIGVFWPNKKDGNPYLMGRKLFDKEGSDFWFIDPDTHTTERI